MFIFVFFGYLLLISEGCTWTLPGFAGNTAAVSDNAEPTQSSMNNDIRALKLEDTLEAYREGEEGINMVSQEQLRKLEFNLGRWRTLPSPLEDNYLEVNIPEYSVTLYKEGKILIKARAIVGKPGQMTPLLHSEIQRIELNPFWEVPKSIATKEILPKLKKNANYLEKNHMELYSSSGQQLDPNSINWSTVSHQLFPFHIHQLPGPWNAVGKIKFVFPNKYNVFLHGTPDIELFDRNIRGFSHGCIRIEDPLSLAVMVMEGTEWTKEKLEAALATGQTKVLRLPQPLPIYLNYWTAWVDQDEILHLEEDVYGLDRNPRANKQ